tara:strand:+ start:219 stop:479 length:261 start_codon:yes stop_codon:yes gene_type:complete
MLEKLAKMQTELRNYQQQQKKQDSLIRERDAEITNLRIKLSKYEDKENKKNKNQSYIHSKALKDVEQKKQNEERKNKDDNQDGSKK